MYFARKPLYLGPYGNPDSLRLYSQLVERWQAGGLAAVASQRVLRLYADILADKFGPIALQAVRSAMIADDLCRNVVNASVHRIRRIFRWADRNELLPETVWRALLSVPALAAGEEGVRESEPIRPASWRQLRAVLRHAPQQVRVIVKLQFLTGIPCRISPNVMPGRWAICASTLSERECVGDLFADRVDRIL